MESPGIVLSGGTQTFQSSVTINIYKRSTKDRVSDECDYNRPVKRAKSTDFYAHAKYADKFYQISNYPKGRVLIVNNEFKDEHDERRGSGKDVFDMHHLWSNMGCGVTVENDLSASKLLERVEEFATHQEGSDFCVVIIMSHGREDDLIVGSERGEVEVRSVVERIKSSKSLEGKPKLIFFQMCRGSNAQKSHLDGEGFDPDDSAWINKMLRELIPNGKVFGSEQPELDANAEQYVGSTPDVMLAFSTQPGYASFRDPTEGSWFIQSIRKVFADKAAKHDVVTLMKMVKNDLKNKKVCMPGTIYDKTVVTMDGSSGFGKKRLMLFPGFPKPQKE